MIDENSTLEEIEAEQERLHKLREKKYREQNSFTVYQVQSVGTRGNRKFSMTSFENIPGYHYRFEAKDGVEKSPYEALTPQDAIEKMRNVLFGFWQDAELDYGNFLDWVQEYERNEAQKSNL